jgi:5-methylcytosine-specific restriction endonuclease McrA
MLCKAKCGSFVKTSAAVYCSNACQLALQWDRKRKEIEKTGDLLDLRRAKRYLRETKEHACQVCLRTTRMSFPIPLVIDHINGDAEDWSLQNMRRICPNCDAQTDTYKGKNRGNGRHARRLRYASGKSY